MSQELAHGNSGDKPSPNTVENEDFGATQPSSQVNTVAEWRCWARPASPEVFSGWVFTGSWSTDRPYQMVLEDAGTHFPLHADTLANSIIS